ncbi:MAG: cytochrome ubiquinol oxidase subunit I [Actinomyces sp.]|jgi:cytochrome d ubiquinol oxidase subunit I|nr:cytochrome ubiquinol oxidase subunit I [Actinomyces sp.]MCI1641310.1 cytochrome ubiquinol oxidase subunit I [Actinomyces sp.]MCI1662129.1 cytochrome ubiquinol oxidase subunit I [Actinomyces sp.]MCI1690888.1 cytochrome ubiquinol oxidase subunit I [Actinomyces sp.]MCI1788894.1 cytochrome ubiquinol oxidase subunit I [Actinomyces sp.]MCI1828927.1 cytochrome ubiquinol oxidase subunit I [Actinomyces sp.]
MTLVPAALDAVTVGRWQFGITTVYHFLLVPLTIGLSLLVAIMQTIWHRTGKDAWLQATRFFGKLLLINFALGVATGIVQEFQFGMNWSEYSRYVGDIFGAPLAVEALLAFFLESTFLGLWIFGWGRLSKGWHLACIWFVAIGTMLSALWILAANSWMQHPVGTVYNAETGRAELDGVGGFLEVITNSVLVWEFAHVIVSAWLIAATFVAGISIWWMTRAAREGGKAGHAEAQKTWRPVAVFGLVIMLVSGVLTIGTGHIQGQEVARVQPMKMAAADGVCVSDTEVAMTVAQFGSCPTDDSGEPTKFIEIPYVSSILFTNDPHGEIQGVADIQRDLVDTLNANPDFVAKYGDAADYDFRPPQTVTFWSFRLMIGLGAFAAVLAAWGLWAVRRGRVPTDRKLGTFALITVPTPFIAASMGWILTEMGRQPWVVVPNLEDLAGGGSVFMLTQAGISTAVPAGQVLATLIVFTLLYLALAVIWIGLMRRYAREGIHSSTADTTPDDESVGALSFGY